MSGRRVSQLNQSAQASWEGERERGRNNSESTARVSESLAEFYSRTITVHESKCLLAPSVCRLKEIGFLTSHSHLLWMKTKINALEVFLENIEIEKQTSSQTGKKNLKQKFKKKLMTSRVLYINYSQQQLKV